MLGDWHEEHGVQRRFRLQRAEAIGATPMVLQRSSCRQEEFRIWYRVGTASWPMPLSGPPPLTAAAGAALIGSRARPERLNYITGGIAVVLSRRQHMGLLRKKVTPFRGELTHADDR